ncbi:MAG: hypothetical protein OEW62_01230 [Candidatus Bathyarchaeota archaeon]|nr:hypothetical protein [Candidatus Bathyarchaeota archaeon]MDH5595210.1 hypothetical protein [Candidatus Bathyarchaeota archaeon]
MYLPRQYVENCWLPSIGEKLDKIHFREPPPGTGHAECDPNSEYCKVHYDKVNPHQNPIGHLEEDSPETLVGLSTASLTGVVVYIKRKNIGEAFLAASTIGLVSYGIAKLVKLLM